MNTISSWVPHLDSTQSVHVCHILVTVNHVPWDGLAQTIWYMLCAISPLADQPSKGETRVTHKTRYQMCISGISAIANSVADILYTAYNEVQDSRQRH